MPTLITTREGACPLGKNVWDCCMKLLVLCWKNRRFVFLFTTDLYFYRGSNGLPKMLKLECGNCSKAGSKLRTGIVVSANTSIPTGHGVPFKDVQGGRRHC